MNYRANKKGFGMLEIVIGTALIFISMFGLVAVSGAAFKAAGNTTRNIQTAFLLEEGLEAMRFLRDSGWNVNIVPLSTGALYYLNFSGGEWEATSSPIFEIDGVFERTFVLGNVYRNTEDDIVSSGGTLDANTKKITFSVSWSLRGATTTKTLSTYIANLYNN